ncbi:BlaI/MecI/CopY family transcriptional regulator [Luxibacter massiliensis]|uniref:BlaI/MecI/CopY family transcriptional regulator n=1 Tax=Luxibacter massiliensis TaxID=2219695 RepID=UPI000F04D3DF|nr:BlaI/MecI/CopY family transcriptional regulator [Luxibacter massiliensis]
MEKLPQISEAEYEIMKIIWADSPISTNEVCEKVPKVHNWSNKTIHTLLSRLTAKHVISYEQRGRMYYYYPIISQKKYLSQENHLFLDRFYNGKAETLLSSLLSSSQLSNADLEKMYELIHSKLKRGDKA